jgi:trigger factor
MRLRVERPTETQANIVVAAEIEELDKIKHRVLKKLAPRVKLAGFRAGKAPIELIEKNVDQQLFQSEFIDDAINTLYIAALKDERLRPVGQPKVEITKFVPFTVLEAKYELPVVGKVKLPDYKKYTSKRAEVKVGKKDVDEVISNLQLRAAVKKEVDRAAKNSDEAWIDFSGVDSKKKAIKGADGKDYPLALGSGTFIPGFEDNVIGMKPGETKDFVVTFPKDYGVTDLQNAKVTFTVKLNKVMEVTKPELDDKFAASVGPFKTVEELKSDVKKQLEHEQKHKVERDFEAALVNELADKTKVAIPETLIEEQEQLIFQEVRQNVVQRGMTYEEFLKNQGKTEEEYKKVEVTPEALRRVKAGLLLGEIGDIEGIDVSAEELEARIQQLKGQYQDKQMQAQLDQPDSRREINARLRTEKVITYLKTV